MNIDDKKKNWLFFIRSNYSSLEQNKSNAGYYTDLKAKKKMTRTHQMTITSAAIACDYISTD